MNSPSHPGVYHGLPANISVLRDIPFAEASDICLDPNEIPKLLSTSANQFVDQTHLTKNLRRLLRNDWEKKQKHLLKVNWHWSSKNKYFIIVELKWDSQHHLQKKTWKTFVATTQSKTSATSLVSTSVAMVNPRRSRRFMNLSEVALRKNMEKKALKIGSQTWWFCHNQVTSCSWIHIILGELWLTLRYAESFRMGKVIWLYHHVYISIEHQVFDPFSSWLLQFVSSQQIGCIPYPWLYLKNIMMAYSHQN